MQKPSTRQTIEAELRYLVPGDERPVYHASEGGKDAKLEMTGEFSDHLVTIYDGRFRSSNSSSGEKFSLDREGFMLVQHECTTTGFYDKNELEQKYLPECESLVARITGATRVVAFDYTLRADDAGIRDSRKIREPSTVVHNDYSVRSGPRRVRDILGEEEAQAVLQNRFLIVNVWRPVHNPVIACPLAVCDAQSVLPEDLVAVERHARERIGELLLVTYNPDHRWYYFSEMQPEEVLLIKTFDSADDGRARSCIHSAFRIPDAAVDALPRESIEVRSFAFFE